MNKLMTATVLGAGTLAFTTFGHTASADEVIQSTQESNYGFSYGSYYTKDLQGDFHHTKNGIWYQAMFDEEQYHFYFVDENGKTHYFYFPKSELPADVLIPDNNENMSQSHSSIEQYGYKYGENNPDYNEVTDTTSNYYSDNYNSDYNVVSDEVVANYNNNAHTNNTYHYNYTNDSNKIETAPVSTNHAPKETATQPAHQSNSNWLTKYDKWQPYGQYTFGGAHYGVDYGMPDNAPIYSLTDGTVIQSGWSSYGGGNQVTIKEKNSDYYQWYMHMNSLNVSAGDTVIKGQQIGAAGSTGNSNGVHLHFQRMKGGVGNEYAVDPTNYVNNN